MFYFFSFYFANLTDVSDILTELFLYFFRFFFCLANSNYTTDLRSPFSIVLSRIKEVSNPGRENLIIDQVTELDGLSHDLYCESRAKTSL